MKDKYTGSLSLEWYNKERTILLRNEGNAKEGDIPAPAVNWINKDDALYYEIIDEEGRGLKPFWVDSKDIRVKEARALKFIKEFTAKKVNKPGTLEGLDTSFEVEEVEELKGDQKLDGNILIKGDNLLALNSLLKYFQDKSEEDRVKCIYIDPPYNTGQAFEYYDDNLSHSEWLTMTRDRFVKLHQLLRNDGVIFVQLDDAEVHYAKVMLDEIFGRTNFINMICYERSGSAGIGQGGLFVDTAEYIIIYAKNKDLLEFNEVLESTPLEFETMKRYNKVLFNKGGKKLVKEFESKSNGLPVKIYKHYDYEIQSISLKDFENRQSEILNEYVEKFENIFRTTNPQAENSFQNELISYMDDGLFSIEYTPSRGKSKDNLTTLYYNNKGIFAWLKDTAVLQNKKVLKTNKLSTVWLHADIPKADLANEGGVELKRSKKPEQLIKKILELSTQKNDIVLDCFGGSGTTASVAHKMGRRWVCVEIGRQAEELIIPRLNNVITGSDQSGVSKIEKWTGGGSFKYFMVDQSIIKLNSDKSIEFNWKLGKDFIEESLLISYDFEVVNDFNLNEDNLFFDLSETPKIGIQKIGNSILIGVISLCPPESDKIMLSYDELYSIYKKITDKYKPVRIDIFTNKGIEIALETKPQNLEVIKVPTAIFSRND
jgi:adenine-specific DNA-methyltransferase